MYNCKTVLRFERNASAGSWAVSMCKVGQPSKVVSTNMAWWFSIERLGCIVVHVAMLSHIGITLFFDPLRLCGVVRHNLRPTVPAILQPRSAVSLASWWRQVTRLFGGFCPQVHLQPTIQQSRRKEM